MACQSLRAVDKARKTARISSEMDAGCRAAKVVLADALTVTATSHKALSRAVGVPARTIDTWVDIDHASQPPLGLLFALPPDARSAAFSLGEVRCIATAPARTVDEQLLWLHGRLAGIAAARRDGRGREALEQWHQLGQDVRALGVLLSREGR